jgi:carboxymethylenebutenolidase
VLTSRWQGTWRFSDLLSGIGISPVAGDCTDPPLAAPREQARFQSMLREARPMAAGAAQSAIGAAPYGRPPRREAGVGDRVGVLGFAGRQLSFALAAADPRIRAAVPFYGEPPQLADVGKIACPVLAFYGERDTRLTDNLAEVSKAMLAAGVDFTTEVYPGVGHAFFNDTNPHTYDPVLPPTPGPGHGRSSNGPRAGRLTPPPRQGSPRPLTLPPPHDQAACGDGGE